MSSRLPSLLTVEGVTIVEVVDVKSLAKMSGGDVDVEPFRVSRNTLGNDEPQLKCENQMCQNCVVVCSG